MDWTFLLTAGSILRQEQHPNHCLCFRTSAHDMVFILLWSAVDGVYVPRGVVLLLLQAYWCQYFYHHVRRDQYLFCCKWRWVLVAVFQMTFKGTVSTRSFEGSIDVGVPMPSQVSPFILSGQVASFLGFLTRDPFLIWNTVANLINRFN